MKKIISLEDAAEGEGSAGLGVVMIAGEEFGKSSEAKNKEANEDVMLGKSWEREEVLRRQATPSSSSEQVNDMKKGRAMTEQVDE